MKNNAQAHILASHTISIAEIATDAPTPIGSPMSGIFTVLGITVIPAGENSAVLSANIRFTVSIPV
ncbi:hypothetical protein ABDB91_12580 [Desulfoscipio sp. XC116]|uniref:hypothetical protein n=1 Tax=Desulfoscipio sp. XC116 TaxID=3144975 RepID=UPI00325BA914